ncbi:MAG: hypothetical protein DDT36_01766 [Firmicutes bacterium]|nr:hypothetical protein [Bacillota bacterium]
MDSQSKVDDMLIDNRNCLYSGYIAPTAASVLRMKNGVKGELNVIGSQWPAVMPYQPRPQPETPSHGLGEPLPPISQGVDYLAVLIATHQTEVSAGEDKGRLSIVSQDWV